MNLNTRIDRLFFVPEIRQKGADCYEKEMWQPGARCTQGINIVVNRRLCNATA